MTQSFYSRQSNEATGWKSGELVARFLFSTAFRRLSCFVGLFGPDKKRAAVEEVAAQGTHNNLGSMVSQTSVPARKEGEVTCEATTVADSTSSGKPRLCSRIGGIETLHPGQLNALWVN